jgi:hypothetical protein
MRVVPEQIELEFQAGAVALPPSSNLILQINDSPRSGNQPFLQYLKKSPV